jgi:DNA-binding IclR family transcriptional regulator
MGSYADGGTRAARRVADVLLLLAESEESIGLSEIATRLDLAKSVVYRIVSALRSRGLVSTDSSGRYEMGVFAVTARRSSLAVTLADVAYPTMLDLRTATEETITLSITNGLERAYIAQVVSHLEVRMSVDLWRLRPLTRGASGKAILAFLPARALTRDDDSDGTRRQIAAISAAHGIDLGTIRRQGVAYSSGESNPHAASVAAPILDRGNTPVGAISVCGPNSRLPIDTLREFSGAVSEAAASISARLNQALSRPSAPV